MLSLCWRVVFCLVFMFNYFNLKIPIKIFEINQALSILGLIWVEIKQLWDAGLHDYCYNLWNILDFITNSLYLCTFALRSVAYYQVSFKFFQPKYSLIGVMDYINPSRTMLPWLKHPENLISESSTFHRLPLSIFLPSFNLSKVAIHCSKNFRYAS